VAQLGSGFGSEFPNEIDTRQVYQNTPSPAPDSNTRIDAEVINDTLSGVINIEETLGVGVMGSYASVAARLDAMQVGGPPPTAPTNVVEFAGETGVLIPGAAHQQGQQALLYAVYDGSVPRHFLAPGSVSVYSTSYNVVTTFEVPQTGVMMVAALTPQYVTSFSTPATPPYVVTIPASAHGLTGPYFFYQAYGTGDPLPAIDVGSLSVNTTTDEVTVGFIVPQSGTLVLATGAPRYIANFTNVTDAAPLILPGAAHGLGTADLLAQVYTTSGNEAVAMPVGTLTVHHSTFEVRLTFTFPQSGTLMLAPVPSTAPTALRVMPEAQRLPLPVLTTRTVQDARRLSSVQETLARVLDRLATLETTCASLRTQLGSPNGEEPSA
jgi:hypothetical protein